MSEEQSDSVQVQEEEVIVYCVECTVELDEDNRGDNGAEICQTCLDDAFLTCEGCDTIGAADGDWHGRDWFVERGHHGPFAHVSYYDDVDMCLCEHCTWVCEHCDRIYGSEERALECCESQSIRYYSYKPNYWRFWHVKNDAVDYTTDFAADGVLYMGIELEMEKTNFSMVEQFLSEAGEPGGEPRFVYFKRDGSLSDRGAELVTMPATLDAFKMKFSWPALSNLRDAGARSFYYSSCGFHIHVARTAFTPTHMYKFIKFQVNNVRMCESIGQRLSTGYASWGDDENWSAKYDTRNVVTKKNYGKNRYAAINFGNYDTIELRYFKGNLLSNAIKRNLEFVDAMFEYTKELKFKDIAKDGYAWMPFAKYISTNRDRYPDLNDFVWNNMEQREED